MLHMYLEMLLSHRLLINFRFQPNAQYFISITMLLYMFRATPRPSSGGPLHICNNWFYVSLFWWPCSWWMGTGLPETCRGAQLLK